MVNEQNIKEGGKAGEFYTVTISEKLILFFFLSPYLLGILILIIGTIAISIPQGFVQYIQFLLLVYIVFFIALLFQKILVSLGSFRISKISKQIKDSAILELENFLKININLKDLRKRWLFHCYCCFGLSLGLVNTICRFLFNDISIQYLIAGATYIASPVLVLLLCPKYYVIKDTTSHFNQFIAKSITGKVSFANTFTILFFVSAMATIEYRLTDILSLSALFLYNLLGV